MIEKNIVLILGAGASHDFGYPLGNDLKARVAIVLKNSNFQKLLRNGYGLRPAIKHSMEDFIDSLKNDRVLTIDKFLENSPSDRQKLGKVAIAQIIMECEDENRLFAQSPNWYRVLFSNMNLSQQLHQFGSNKLSIITFNYDRSLEHYFHASLASEYRSSTDDEIRA